MAYIPPYLLLLRVFGPYPIRLDPAQDPMLCLDLKRNRISELEESLKVLKDVRYDGFGVRELNFKSQLCHVL